MSTYPQNTGDDLDGPGSHGGVLDLGHGNPCVLKYVVGVKPDLKSKNNVHKHTHIYMYIYKHGPPMSTISYCLSVITFIRTLVI